ncbi:hypothetical protein V9T40_008251 [Parthenolecanium corni]|uniref:TIR domain-containing protein n=1 Tax=Parthenolecanium corni TaxID=536013 RepID=A0AAN9TKJ4_9HEMI
MKNNTDEINFYEIPVKALLLETRKKLSCMLNRPKVLMSPNNHPRDYRGLGDLMGVNTLSNWFPDNDFVQNLLRLWEREKPGESNLGRLREFFELIDRFDVLDDTYEMFVRDATEYRHQSNEVSYSPEEPEFCKEILTTDDVQRYRKGLPLRIYDAFLLYVSADEEFAKQLITTLEGRFNLRLCEKDRDFRGGIDIEWSAIFKIISKRCRKLLVILSPEFLQSDYHTYFVQLTQSLTFHQKGSSRVIPCLYKDCPLSDEFRAFHILDHRRANGLVDFWEKLNSSIVPLEQENISDYQIMPLSRNDLAMEMVNTSDSTQEKYSWQVNKNVNGQAEILISTNIPSSDDASLEEHKSTLESKSSASIKSVVIKYLRSVVKKKKRDKPVIVAAI